MKILYEHLAERIVERPSIKDISNKLFQLGHEHDLENNIFDIEITPNRGDCLSVDGLLRDLNIFYQTIPRKEIFNGNIEKFNFNFKNDEKDACPYISFLEIEIGDYIESYNESLESYFRDLNNKKINFFTDLSNYLSYETGQPTHCYDSMKIPEGLTLGRNQEKTKFMTLLDKEIEIKENNLLFFNNDKIVNLAGIVGGKNSACDDKTKSVIVECAYFNPEEILGKSIQYNINSDAAYKFERGVDPSSHEYVLRRFIQITSEHTSIKNLKLLQKNYTNIIKSKIECHVSEVNKILGTDIDDNYFKQLLHNLGFEQNGSVISIPHFRSDVCSINDIAEEVARSVGYNNIPRKNFTIAINKKNSDKKELEQSIHDLLVDNGFYEVINAPFSRIESKSKIVVDNPLDKNKPYLRTNLKEALLENLLFNERRQKDSIKLYEISDVYYFKEKVIKKRILGVIASGRVGKNYKNYSQKIDQKYIQNIMDIIFPNHALDIQKISRNEIQTKQRGEIIYTEIILNEIDQDFSQYIRTSEKKSGEFIQYSPISEFPFSYRDLSFSVTKSSSLENLLKTLDEFKHEMLKEVFIFDFYKNEKKEEIKIGYRFIFQSTKETITEGVVEEIINSIIRDTTHIDSVEIPGLKK